MIQALNQKNKQQISISEIVIDPRYQVRVSMDEKAIGDYVELIEASQDDWPFADPVTLFEIDEKLYLTDGWHRIEACTRTGHSVVVADVRSGTAHDAFLYALSANSSHGLRRSNADKRNAVRLALEDDQLAGLSNRKLAKACRVSESFVRKLKSNDMAGVIEKCAQSAPPLVRNQAEDEKCVLNAPSTDGIGPPATLAELEERMDAALDSIVDLYLDLARNGSAALRAHVASEGGPMAHGLELAAKVVEAESDEQLQQALANLRHAAFDEATGVLEMA